MAARETKSATLFLAGVLNATGLYKGMDLYTTGPSIYSPSGSVDLYVSGLTVPSGSGGLNLYINGDPLSFSGILSCTLYIQGQGESLYCPLYIKGKFTDSDFPFNNGLGSSDSMNLYMDATGTNPPDAALIYTTGTKYLNLYIEGGTTGISSGLTLYVNGSSPVNNYFPLYSYGISGNAPTGLNLYCSGVGYNYSYTDLFIRGY